MQRSCEDNGIRMEVTAAYIHENTAEIYLSLEDLTGTSFDETVDLFDSYRLHTPFDCTGHCQLASYDPDTHTATFLVTLEQWDRHRGREADVFRPKAVERQEKLGGHFGRRGPE